MSKVQSTLPGVGGVRVVAFFVIKTSTRILEIERILLNFLPAYHIYTRIIRASNNTVSRRVQIVLNIFVVYEVTYSMYRVPPRV